MTLEQLLKIARASVQTIGANQRPIDDPDDWNHYQLARGVLDLFDSAKSSAGPANLAHLRAVVARCELSPDAQRELSALLDLFDAACAWRHVKAPHNERRLIAAIDASRRGA